MTMLVNSDDIQAASTISFNLYWGSPQTALLVLTTMARGNHDDQAIFIRLLKQLTIANPVRCGDLVTAFVTGMGGQ